MRFVRTIRSQPLIIVAAALLVASNSELSQVAAADGLTATIGAQAMEAVQKELACW